jgi:hypothetical protein
VSLYGAFQLAFMDQEPSGEIPTFGTRISSSPTLASGHTKINRFKHTFLTGSVDCKD